MTVNNGATGDKHQIETMPADVAVLDYDGDGWPDNAGRWSASRHPSSGYRKYQRTFIRMTSP
jgi:hypothetical protein